jgi:hypothetical protein
MTSKHSSVPILSWIGPWTFNAFVGATEGDRPDVNNARCAGMRFTFQPLPIVELGISRSAQLCGQNPAGTRPPCYLSTIARMALGKDNVGYHGINRQNEPGNQMAGFDARIVSPFRLLPVAVYAQMIAEDNGSGIIPNRWLAPYGRDLWAYFGSGSVFRGQLEYATMSCTGYTPAPSANCTYRQGIFFAGCRYFGRNIAYTTGSDSETWALRLSLTEATGETWALKLRHGHLDRHGGVDVFNNLTRGPSKYDAAELGWQGSVLGQDIVSRAGSRARMRSLQYARTVLMASSSGASAPEFEYPSSLQ